MIVVDGPDSRRTLAPVYGVPLLVVKLRIVPTTLK
jgi:hypothetical protein